MKEIHPQVENDGKRWHLFCVLGADYMASFGHTISKASGGTAYTANDADQLSGVYENLGSRLGTKKEEREITAVFAGGGLILLLGAAFAGLRTTGRLP